VARPPGCIVAREVVKALGLRVILRALQPLPDEFATVLAADGPAPVGDWLMPPLPQAVTSAATARTAIPELRTHFSPSERHKTCPHSDDRSASSAPEHTRLHGQPVRQWAGGNRP
jgi:hypothetical protein